MNEFYRPEGRLIGLPENREYLSCEASLRKAAAEGKILESIALYCEDRGEGKELGIYEKENADNRNNYEFGGNRALVSLFCRAY